MKRQRDMLVAIRDEMLARIRELQREVDQLNQQIAGAE